MELLTASSLRSVHGFPTRAGGASTGAFASLNSSFAVGDDPAAVRANLEALARAAKVNVDQLFTVKQVHGDRVVSAAEAKSDTEADALITRVPNTAVGVRTADCLPVLLEDRRTGAVAAVHAGWRGVIAQIVARAIKELIGDEGKPGDVHAAIGPCIQKCCFEVDGDLPERFSTAFGQDVVIAGSGGAGKTKLDLVRAVQVTLERAGIPSDHVASLPQCTMCDTRFFSHRRDQGITGRHLSFIRSADTSAG
ncbi:MAG: peptidoglycan editing factor PgeF [Archangium sp.]|nr:peptidoglycan editing factor PgeF [Archangium sp.]